MRERYIKKHIHILGICGTFMGGIAVLAKQLGYKVTGSDQHIYPPMSLTLQAAGIDMIEGYEAKDFLKLSPTQVIIGNALSRGNPVVEYILNQRIPYTSGAAWIAEHILSARHVLAVSGTHGKTTTTSLLTWILTTAGLNPGFLIGGVANNFSSTANLGDSDYFVIEADEYDTAFFDKRSKFIHYRPQTLIINNLEFDHGDIFPDLEAIKKQFQYLIRLVPETGQIIYPVQDQNINEVIKRDCWSKQIKLGTDWKLKFQNNNVFISHTEKIYGPVQWPLQGRHNAANALAAIAAANQIGVPIEKSIEALSSFQGVKRRLEVLHKSETLSIYDDFAHHPTAIQTVLQTLRNYAKQRRIIAVLQFGSNSMSNGMHEHKEVIHALKEADAVFMLRPTHYPTFESLLNQFPQPAKAFNNVEEIIQNIKLYLKPADQIIIMSNKGFDGIQQKLLTALIE